MNTIAESHLPLAAEPPPFALRLGYAGLIPFLGGALLVWLVWPQMPMHAYATMALSAYAAVIVSFLGGIHWGIAFREAEPPPSLLQVPGAMLTDTWPWGPDWNDRRACVLADAYLGPWRDHDDPASLRALLDPARRLAILHRCESWRRLTDLDGELPDHPSMPILRDHLLAATGESRA